MATPSKYAEQGFKLYRKSNAGKRIPIVTYSQLDGACFEDDGYDLEGISSVVDMLKHEIDQGHGDFYNVSLGITRSTGEQPVSQEVHDKWMAVMYDENWLNDPDESRPPKKEKINVFRTEPKILSMDEFAEITLKANLREKFAKRKPTVIPQAKPKPVVVEPKPTTHLYTMQEDKDDIELCLQQIEAMYKIRISREGLIGLLLDDIRYSFKGTPYLSRSKRITWTDVYKHLNLVEVT